MKMQYGGYKPCLRKVKMFVGKFKTIFKMISR